MYICKFCGREFETPQGYASHIGKCKLNPNRIDVNALMKKARDGHDNKTEYTCKFCGKICIGKNSLAQHEIRCKDNPDKINNPFVSNFIKYNEDCRCGKRHHPHYGQTKFTCESLRKASETKMKKYKNGELVGGFSGKNHTEETKCRKWW